MRKNLKKRLAMVLAAAMVFSTPVAVNKTTASAAAEPTVITASTTEADVVAKGGFNTSFSNYYKGTGNFEAVFNVHMDEVGVANWNTEFFAITTDANRSADGYVEYLYLRADQYNVTEATRPNTEYVKDWFTADADNGIVAAADWSAWLTAMNNADLEITVTRADDVFTVTRVLTAADGKKYSMVARHVQEGSAESVRMFMGADASAFTIKSYTYKEVPKPEAVAVSNGAVKVSDDKTKIDYSFSAATAPANAEFEVSVTASGSAVSTTGSAVAAEDGTYTYSYAPAESGTYTFKVTGVKVAGSDVEYVLDGDAAAAMKVVVEDGKIVSGSEVEVPGGEEKPPVTNPPATNPPATNPPATNPPATNPPATNPPATNPPATNPPAAGTVKKVTVKAQNQKAGTKTVYLKKGGKVTLTATVTGTGKFSKAVTWTSSKKAVATVSSKGVVKAKKAGTAKITVASKTNKAKKATITIKVAKKAKKNKKLTLKAKKKNLKKGKTYTVAIKSMTKGTTDAVTYKTNKKKIATVDKFGVVKAKKKGTAVITVKCGKKKAKLTIKVK